MPLLYYIPFDILFEKTKCTGYHIYFIIIINASPPDRISEGMHILYADGFNILS